MSQFIALLLSFLCSTLSAAILMPWLLNLCHKHELTYAPTQTNHFRIPRLGGIILAPATAIGMAASLGLRLYDDTISDTLKSSSLFIALGIMIIYLAGIIDDIFGLNRWQKRTVLICASLAFPLCGLYLNDLYGFCGFHHLGYYFGFTLTAFATFLIAKGIEALNDSDGLAGGICLVPLIAFGVIFYIQGYYSYATLAITMTGALLVYLYYNLLGDERIGTKTYMGHAGSLIMSYCIIYLSLKYAMDNTLVINSHADGLVVSYSMLIIPLFEYIRVLAFSSWNGLSKDQRRQQYIQHKLESKGYTQLSVLIITLCVDILFIAVNLVLHYIAHLNLTWIVAIDILLYTSCQYAINIKKENTKTKETVLPKDFPEYQGEAGLVSVIMATWNSEKFVKESIDSIIAQTYKNWELIITDDCSTDSTMAILKEYAKRDPRIKIQKNKKNGGAGVSRNHSIESANGQYIAFCDSDDRWMPNKLEKQLAFMQNNEVALCFSPYYSCNEFSEYLGYISAPRRVNLFQMMCDNKIGFLTAIYDTHILGKHPIPKQRKRQDHALLLNLLKICRYAYSVPEPLAHYRIHPGNMSKQKISLLKYNAQTYTEVFGWAKPFSYLFLFTFFMPTYFTKKLKNILLTVARAI